MDNNQIAYLFGKDHADEVSGLIENNSAVMDKIHLRNPKVTLILSIFLGILAIDRLYQAGPAMFGYKLGMLLLTLGTWWIVDIGYSIKTTQEANYNKIISAV